MDNTFTPFPKIPRLNRDVVVTEKIDGTNAQIEIVRLMGPPEGAVASRYPDPTSFGLYMFAASRNRYITPENDNQGFAAWVKANAAELWSLGEGRHYGEWWGSGIQRGYGLTKGDKRFSLFNVAKWSDERPACCGVVPTLYQGPFDTAAVGTCIERLKTLGSVAAPGFMNPEGVIVFHTAGSLMFKVTCEGDDAPKSRQR